MKLQAHPSWQNYYVIGIKPVTTKAIIVITNAIVTTITGNGKSIGTLFLYPKNLSPKNFVNIGSSKNFIKASKIKTTTAVIMKNE